MPQADIVTRPSRFTWDGYPSQVRTLQFDGSGAGGFPDDYLTGRTYELRLRGVTEPYDAVVDNTAKTVTFVDVTVPDVTGPVRVLLVDTTTATDDVIARGVVHVSDSGSTPDTAATIAVTTTDEVTFALEVTVMSAVIEGAQDIVGAMFTGNTETGIAATYDDTTGKVNLVAEVTQAALDTEAATRAAADTALDGRLDTAETTLSGLGSVATLDTGTAAGEVRTNSQNDGTYAPLAATDPTYIGPAFGDLISEWWLTPSATYLSTWNKTYLAGISRSGEIKVGWYDHGTGEQHVVIVGQAIRDDHCAPCLIVDTGQPPVVMWTNHGDDNLVHVLRGKVVGSIDLWNTEVTIDLGAAASYTQALRSGANIHLLSRGGDRAWYYVKSTDNGATWAAPVKWLEAGVSEQIYVTAAATTFGAFPGFRIAITGHPTSSTIHEVYYGTIRFNSGSTVFTAATSSTIGTMGTDLMAPSSFHTAMAAPAGGSTRLFNVTAAGADPAIACATWGADGIATYHYLDWNGSNGFNKRDVCLAGDVIGYTESVKYLGGMWFPTPAVKGVVYLAREDDGVWYMEKATSPDTEGVSWTFEEIASGSTILARPIPVKDAHADLPLLWHEISRYEGYTDYTSRLVGGQRPVAA